MSANLDRCRKAGGCRSSPLWDLPNVVLTPHIAGPVGTELALIADAAIDEVQRILSGQPLERAVLESRFNAIA